MATAASLPTVPADPVTSAPAGDPVPQVAGRPSTSPARRVLDLLGAVPGLRPVGVGDTLMVHGCTHDSRAVQPGDLWAALPGARVHGAEHAAQAAEAGAVAVLTDLAGIAAVRAAGLPALVADDPRALLGAVAADVHGHPAEGMTVLGVTGTNGKTTTAYLLDAGLRAADRTTGLVGTVETRLGDSVLASERTTPEATDLQALLAVMREREVTAVTMEVSSHALVLGRVDGLVFDVAAFTNLSQDHLDFHGDMASYEAAKAELFTPARTKRAVVDIADPAGARLAVRALVPTVTCGSGDLRTPATWRAEEVEPGPEGSTFRLVGPGVDLPAAVRLPGAFNVANAVLALATLAEAGIDVEAAVDGVAALAGVPGRMERVDAGQSFLAVVDYAHTPDAVTTLLAALRPVTEGRLIVVLGCGGDRDRAKRPLMGRAAAAGADLSVLTSDNPRSEDPGAILAEMAVGVPDGADTVREPDRRAAIAYAVAQARPGDAVVVAGKGHETGQEAGGVKTPFDDRLVLHELLAAL